MGFKVTVDGTHLRFGAAHFITMGGKCERLHGHNYGVAVVVEGPLGPDRYVIDFVALKQIVRDICEMLDHRFLLPTRNPQLDVSQADGHWQIRFGERRYVFPERDVLPLPLDNVTAERLAEYIWGILVKELCGDGQPRPTSISVGVEEAPGQTAWYSAGVE